MWLQGDAGEQKYSKSLDVHLIVAGELQTPVGWVELRHAGTVTLM